MFGNEKNKKWLCMIMVILCSLGPAMASTTWLEKDKLFSSDGLNGDCFGCSVSISGDYAIIGASSDDGSGSAFIFTPNEVDPNNWDQLQKLLAPDGATNDNFGGSVSIDGYYAIIGARFDDDNGEQSGSAYTFRWNGTTWVYMQKLIASHGTAGDRFGESVSISGDYAIVGTYSESAYIFKRVGSYWVEEDQLFASDGVAGDYFGYSVSISGDYAIVGAYNNDVNGSDSGSAYVFMRSGTNWTEQAKLLASDGAASDQFGFSVSINGEYAIVGAPGYSLATGKAYIFKRTGSSWWNQQAKLLASDGATWDWFGESASISGDCAIVGAYDDDDNGISSGSAYIFKRNGTSWVEKQKLLASDGTASDRFGWSVSINGDYAIAGSTSADGNATNSGSAYIYKLTPTGTLALLAPNGGEELVAGSTYDITWDTDGIVEDVFIEYSDNNGVDWATIDTVANADSYEWLVPDVNSEQCLVRISDSLNPNANDVSDNVFRIYVCTLVYDFNYDCLVDFFDFSLLAAEWLKCGDPCDPNCQP